MDTAHESELERLATYDPEDDKIRIRATERFSEEEKELLDRLKFQWAPHQKLFFRVWTPAAQATALLLCGQEEMELEDETPAERAEAKAKRLAVLAHKRAGQANQANATVAELNENSGAILQGHASQRKAEKEAQKRAREEQKAKELRNAADHWAHRAKATIQHERRRQSPEVIARRVKTLRSEARKVQKQLTQRTAIAEMIKEAQQLESPTERAERAKELGRLLLRDYTRILPLQDKAWDPDETLERNLKFWQDPDQTTNLIAFTRHRVARANYFAEQLDREPYRGVVTEAIVRKFGREFEVYVPNSRVGDEGNITLTTNARFPEAFRELADGQFDMEAGRMTASPRGWLDIFEDMRYIPELPRKSAKAAKPLLNYMPKSGKVAIPTLYSRPGEPPEVVEVKEMTKEEFKRIPPDMKGTREPVVGSREDQHRIRYTVGTKLGEPGYCVVLTNQKNHPEPETLHLPEPTPESC